jgi:hypothetical protein
MASTVDDQVKHHKLRFLASVLCMDNFGICKYHAVRYDDCLIYEWRKDVVVHAERLSITQAVCLSSISDAIAAEKPYEVVHNEIERILHAFTALRMRITQELDQILALCTHLDRSEIQQKVPRSDPRDPESTLKARYVEHVNDTSWNPARFASIKWRIDDLSDFMWRGEDEYATSYDNFIRCIPVLTEAGKREIGNWTPHLDIRRFLSEADFTPDHAFCRIMMSTECIVESIENEVRDILDEIRAWKTLQCALALHRRLGARSLLGALGEDLVRIVVKLLLE